MKDKETEEPVLQIPPLPSKLAVLQVHITRHGTTGFSSETNSQTIRKKFNLLPSTTAKVWITP